MTTTVGTDKTIRTPPTAPASATGNAQNGKGAAGGNAAGNAAVTVTTAHTPVPSFTASAAPLLASAKLSTADLDTLMTLISQLNTTLATRQADTMSEGLKINADQKAQRTRDMQDAFNKAEESAKKARELAGTSDTMGWVSAIGQAIGAVAAMVAVGASVAATGGASAPLITLTVAMTVQSVQDLTTMANKQNGYTVQNALGETKTLDITWGGLADMAFASAVADFGTSGMTPEELEQARTAVGVAVNVLVIAAFIALGSGASDPNMGAVAITKAAQSANAVRTAGNVERVSEGVGVAADATAATSSIVKGKVDMDKAEVQSDTNRNRAWKDFFEKMLKNMDEQDSIARKLINTIVEMLDGNFRGTSDQLKALDDNRSRIARNMQGVA